METFGIGRYFKRFMAFGILFFAACCTGSVMLSLFPPANEHNALPWVMPVCAVTHAGFSILCFCVWRMLDDTVEISEKGIASRRRRESDVEIAWDEIVAVDASLQGCCLKLRTADDRIIRVEYQFDNFHILLNLLECNIPLLENSGAAVSFQRITVEPDRLICKRLFRPRIIEMKNIRDVRMELINNAIFILVKEAGTDKHLKLTYTRKIFHLAQLLRHQHERCICEAGS